MSSFKLNQNANTPEFRDEIVKNVKSFEDLAGEAPETTCENIFKAIAKEIKAPENQSQEILIAISCILQRGGTSKNAPSSMKMTIKGLNITLDVIRRHTRANNVSVRQFARGIKDDIVSVMEFLGDNAPDGNLAKTMRLDHSDLTKNEAIWASDFQTYNPQCTGRVKTWLVKNYRARFRRG